MVEHPAPAAHRHRPRRSDCASHRRARKALEVADFDAELREPTRVVRPEASVLPRSSFKPIDLTMTIGSTARSTRARKPASVRAWNIRLAFVGGLLCATPNFSFGSACQSQKRPEAAGRGDDSKSTGAGLPRLPVFSTSVYAGPLMGLYGVFWCSSSSIMNGLWTLWAEGRAVGNARAFSTASTPVRRRLVAGELSTSPQPFVGEVRGCRAYRWCFRLPSATVKKPGWRGP